MRPLIWYYEYKVGGVYLPLGHSILMWCAITHRYSTTKHGEIFSWYMSALVVPPYHDCWITGDPCYHSRQFFVASNMVSLYQQVKYTEVYRQTDSQYPNKWRLGWYPLPIGLFWVMSLENHRYLQPWQKPLDQVCQSAHMKYKSRNIWYWRFHHADGDEENFMI